MALALGEMEAVWVEMEMVLKQGLEDVKSSIEMVGFSCQVFVLFLAFVKSISMWNAYLCVVPVCVLWMWII